MMFSEAYADRDYRALDDYAGHHALTMADPIESQFVHAVDTDLLTTTKARIFLLRDNFGRIDCAGHVVQDGGGLEWQGVSTHKEARGQGKATDLACFARWTYASEGLFDFGCVVRILPDQGINERALQAFTKAGFVDTGKTLHPKWVDHLACRHLRSSLEVDGTYRVRRLAANASTLSPVKETALKFRWR
ncbi:hypothetical protein [Rhizobium leguminosarum]|nr:hypothetical protein HB775_28610 [Rhizobium leguminosarum bv. trifolii]